MNLIVSISEPIQGFRTPSTPGQPVGALSAGIYPVLDVIYHTQAGGCDFAKIRANHLPKGMAWVPIQHTPTSTVHLSAPDGTSPQRSPKTTALSVREADLLDTLLAYKGFGYSLHQPSYPVEIPGVKLPNTGNDTNCCCFAEGLLVGTFFREHQGMGWNTHRHNQMMIAGPQARPFDPITAAQDSGMATPIVGHNPAPGPWTLVQGWGSLSPLKQGHTFFVLRHHARTDKVLTLEATNHPAVKGVGHKGIGKAVFKDDTLILPDNWWELKGVPTWDELHQRFPFMKTAEIHVSTLETV